MGRAERRSNEETKYIKRLKAYASTIHEIIDDSGNRIKNPTFKDLMEIQWLKKKKNHATICSCPLCKDNKFDRKAQKKADNQAINDELNDYKE
jgi:hypothetical protein